MKRHLFLSLAASCCLMRAEIYNLGVVEVSAKSDIHAISTDTSSQKDIKNAKNKTILEALRTKLGVFVSSLGARNKDQVRIRAFHNSRVAMFLDGMCRMIKI